MNQWWPPGPISIGFLLAVIAAWVLWFRDRVLAGPMFADADILVIAVAGTLGAVLAYAIEVGSRRARARVRLRTSSPEGPLEPQVWLSRAHASLDEMMANATGEARALRHNYIGSEHLLLGALRTDTGATRVVQRFGVSLDVARSAVGRIVGTGAAEAEILGVSPRVKEALKAASSVARELGHSMVRVPHVWLAILDLDHDAISSRTLSELDVDRSRLRVLVHEEAASSSDDERRWPRTDIRAAGEGPAVPPRAVRVGSSVMVAGTGPRGLPAAEAADPARQAERCLELIDEVLDAAGSRLGELVWLRVYVRDAATIEAVRAVCIGAFREEAPAMTFVVAGLPEADWAVMLEGDAIIGQHRATTG